jgi:hypothetical protein
MMLGASKAISERSHKKISDPTLGSIYILCSPLQDLSGEKVSTARITGRGALISIALRRLGYLHLFSAYGSMK